jgi:hypothetical protein
MYHIWCERPARPEAARGEFSNLGFLMSLLTRLCRRNPATNKQSLRNQMVHRALSLATFDLRLITLLRRAQKTLAQDVQAWYHRYHDDGASLYFHYTRPDPSFPPFGDRWSVCAYLVGASPKMRYLCGILYDALYGEAGDRGMVLIFVNWPIEMWLIRCLGGEEPDDQFFNDGIGEVQDS